jgi:hypothetical protein
MATTCPISASAIFFVAVPNTENSPAARAWSPRGEVRSAPSVSLPLSTRAYASLPACPACAVFIT